MIFFASRERNPSQLSRIISPHPQPWVPERGRTMKKTIPATVIFLAGLILFLPIPIDAVEVGQKAPDFELPSTRGGTIKLSGLRGSNVLINFYLTDYSPT